MAEFINSIDVLGDDAVADSIIERNIISYTDDEVNTVGGQAFNYCTSLTNVVLPSVTTVLNGFSYCSSLISVDLTSIVDIGNAAFSYCSALTTLILRNAETVVTLENSGAFISTPIAQRTGYIYVPRALLSDDDATKDYRRATNWSNYANLFRALEDYTVDGTITGELDTTKI